VLDSAVDVVLSELQTPTFRKHLSGDLQTVRISNTICKYFSLLYNITTAPDLRKLLGNKLRASDFFAILAPYAASTCVLFQPFSVFLPGLGALPFSNEKGRGKGGFPCKIKEMYPEIKNRYTVLYLKYNSYYTVQYITNTVLRAG
jgi:hypothetical protein